MVYDFLGKDEKTCRNLYLLSLKNIIVEKKSDIFPYNVSKPKPCDYPPLDQFPLKTIDLIS